MTRILSLLEVPLSWQEAYVQQLDQQNCDTKTCIIQASNLPNKSE